MFARNLLFFVLIFPVWGFSLTLPNGRQYVGNLKYESPNGQGIEYNANGTISRSGTWKDGALVLEHQISTFLYPFDPKEAASYNSQNTELKKSSYPPCPSIGVKNNCFGETTYPDSSKYVGEWEQNKRNGRGTFYWPDGLRLTGIWSSDRPLLGIEYNSYGRILRSGSWQGNVSNLTINVKSNLDTSLYPFDPYPTIPIDQKTQIAQISEVTSFAQTNLTPCEGVNVFKWNNCFGNEVSGNGDNYIGEFKDGRRNGLGSLTFGPKSLSNGYKHVGEFKDYLIYGNGIRYASNGTVLGSGYWEGNLLLRSFSLDATRYPFEQKIQTIQNDKATQDPEWSFFVTSKQYYWEINEKSIEKFNDAIVFKMRYKPENEDLIKGIINTFKNVKYTVIQTLASCKSQTYSTFLTAEINQSGEYVNEKIVATKDVAYSMQKPMESNAVAALVAKKYCSKFVNITTALSIAPKKNILDVKLPTGWESIELNESLLKADIKFAAINKTTGVALRQYEYPKNSVISAPAYARVALNTISRQFNSPTLPKINEYKNNGINVYNFEIAAPQNGTNYYYSVSIFEFNNYILRLDFIGADYIFQDSKKMFSDVVNAFKPFGTDGNQLFSNFDFSEIDGMRLSMDKPAQVAVPPISQNSVINNLSPLQTSYANRKALIIGNDTYKSVGKLVNAREDAKAMASNLNTFGYQVTLKLDLNEKEMKSAIRNFAGQVQGGDEVLFFFSGHGVQLGAANYLLPIDIIGESEAQIRDESIQLQRILDDMSERKAKFTLAMVDACRDNPFKSTGRAIGGRGLAPTTAATGQMVIFSAGAGQQAMDRLNDADKNKNGLFTRVFIQEIQTPGLSIDRVVKNVRNKVAELAKSVGHEQVPAIYDQVLGDFYFRR